MAFVGKYLEGPLPAGRRVSLNTMLASKEVPAKAKPLAARVFGQ